MNHDIANSAENDKSLTGQAKISGNGIKLSIGDIVLFNNYSVPSGYSHFGIVSAINVDEMSKSAIARKFQININGIYKQDFQYVDDHMVEVIIKDNDGKYVKYVEYTNECNVIDENELAELKIQVEIMKPNNFSCVEE